MKKIFTSLALAGVLAGTLSANQAPSMNPYDEEFAKMNQYFNSLIDSHFNAARLNNISYPRTDVLDTQKMITIKFDLAGVPKENIKLSIDENNILTLEGQKQNSKEEKAKGYVKREIFYGSFEKAIQLPDNIEQDKLETSFKDGILTVTIPKKEIKKPKAKIIPIK